MKIHLFTHTLTALAGLALVTACGGPSSPDATEIEMSYGAVTAADEAPFFADERVEREDAADRDVDEPADADRARDADEMRARPDAATIVLTVRYGNLAGRDRAAPARWPFEVRTGGVISGVRLALDDDEDGGLTRLDDGVSWHSATAGEDDDGARMRIDYQLDGDPQRGVALDTDGLHLLIPFRELADHRSFHRLPQGEVFVSAYRVAPDRDLELCRGGVIRARVSPLGDDGVGRFFGLFTNHAGDRVGHVRGIYGVRENGDQAIFGKMISRNGAFEARFRGLWERAEPGLLAFRARLHARDHDAIGVVRGRIADTDGRGGVMMARWALACDATIDRTDLPADTDAEERARPSADAGE